MRSIFNLFIVLSFHGKSVLSQATSPNVIIVLTDDLGFGDVEYNCHDNSTGIYARISTNQLVFIY